MAELLKASIKSTIDKADSYALAMLASSLAFTVLCFPEAQVQQTDQSVKWQLLGFPLNFQPALALIVLYCIFVVSSLLTDNMLIHIGDLARRIDDKPLVVDLLSHPSVLTVSPIGAVLTTLLPSLFLLLGFWRLFTKGQYDLPGFVWLLAAGFGTALGAIVYVRVLQNVRRFQNP